MAVLLETIKAGEVTGSSRKAGARQRRRLTCEFSAYSRPSPGEPPSMAICSPSVRSNALVRAPRGAGLLGEQQLCGGVVEDGLHDVAVQQCLHLVVVQREARPVLAGALVGSGEPVSRTLQQAPGFIYVDEPSLGSGEDVAPQPAQDDLHGYGAQVLVHLTYVEYQVVTGEIHVGGIGEDMPEYYEPWVPRVESLQ